MPPAVVFAWSSPALGKKGGIPGQYLKMKSCYTTFWILASIHQSGPVLLHLHPSWRQSRHSCPHAHLVGNQMHAHLVGLPVQVATPTPTSTAWSDVCVPFSWLFRLTQTSLCSQISHGHDCLPIHPGSLASAGYSFTKWFIKANQSTAVRDN